MRKYLVILLFLMHAFPGLAQIKSPASFLGYSLGSRFTPHAQVVSYFQHAASADKNIRLIEYGRTYEGRPLLAAIISAPENMARLEEIRKNNVALTSTDPAVGRTPGEPAILWLSYNVHGNEASSTETAMRMLYALSEPTAQIKAFLKNTVVIIDPCLNPDGRDRYVNFFNGVSGRTPNPDPGAREHSEPWPGGRVNHYYFDLNRDWAWQTQIESKQRVALYQQWMPQVHVDYHEQSYNEPYYFAPAAEPIHADITQWQRSFQETVGKNNAKYFDANGWHYFTKERFDLLYPAYGDTYPMYNGAIGMTYEQGGIRAGLSVITTSGDTLTLSDRIEHHFTTGLATLETVSANAPKLLTEFKRFFTNPKQRLYKTYLIKGENQERLKKLTDLLALNNIKYAFGSERNLSGYSFLTKKQESFKAGRNDLIVNLKQSRAMLASVLLEPETFVSDSNTYDITAWALPYAYGLPAYALKEDLAGTFESIDSKPGKVAAIDKPFAWAMPWSGMSDARLLASLHKAQIKVRLSEESFILDGRLFPVGTLLIYRSENEISGRSVSTQLSAISGSHSKTLVPLSSGFVEKGKDLGSNVYPLLTMPKIAIASGTEVSSQGLGEIWHFLEEDLGYPYIMVSPQALATLDINRVNVLVLPDGNYSETLHERLNPWISAGGKLILIEDAINGFVGKKGYDIARKEVAKAPDAAAKPRPFADRHKEELTEILPGAIFKVKLDSTHPLNSALGAYYFTLKTDDKLYEPFKSGFSTGMLGADSYVSGVAGKNIVRKLNDGMLFGVNNLGRGKVIVFGTNPLFRAFWESGKMMFVNSLFLVD